MNDPIELQSVNIYRGGVTAPYLSLVSHRWTLKANESKKTLEFTCWVAFSRGTTTVQQEIGEPGFPAILKAMTEVVGAPAILKAMTEVVGAPAILEAMAEVVGAPAILETMAEVMRSNAAAE